MEFNLFKIFWGNTLQFKSCLKMSLKIFLNETSNTSMHWNITERKSDNIYFFNACLYICGKYKEPVAYAIIKSIMILDRETITAELLLTKLAHKPLFSFTVEKTALSHKIQWNWMLGKALYGCWLFCSGCIRYVDMNRPYIYFSITYIRVRPPWKIAILCQTYTRNVGVF